MSFNENAECRVQQGVLIPVEWRGWIFLQCKNCAREISDDSVLCNFCWSKVKINPICPSYRVKLVEESLFCNKCGTKVTQAIGKPKAIQGFPMREEEL